MAQHDNEHAHAWTCSDTLAQALRGHTDLSPADQLALLVAQGQLVRWRAMATRCSAGAHWPRWPPTA